MPLPRILTTPRGHLIFKGFGPALVAAILAGASVVRAQDEGAAPDPEEASEETAPSAAASAAAVQSARDAYRRGEAFYEAGNFAAAESAFQEAFAAVSNPVVLLSIAECQERDHRGFEAVATLRRYLALRQNAPDADSVAARIDALEGQPGVLLVNSEPQGASIELNGELQDETTPARLELPPGEYQVVLRKEGVEPAEDRITVEFATHHELALEMPAVGEGGRDGTPADAVAQGDDNDLGAGEGGVPTSVWVATGVAGAGLVAGTVLGFVALSKQADFDDMPSDATADDGETLALFADLSFGIGAAAAVTAIVLYLTHDAEEEEEPELSLSPVLTPELAGVSGQVRF